ncbi:MAG: DUF2306 domain-containing protein, partial [Gammaproteobacteria bacterium]
MQLLLNEPPPIPLHAFAAMVAIVLGAIQFYLAKGTQLHTVLGRLWVGIMAIVALSSFFISGFKTFGYFSPIHVLSAWTIFALVWGIYHARQGNIQRHKTTMKLLYGLALILTGLFTLLPGRVMHAVLFG